MESDVFYPNICTRTENPMEFKHKNSNENKNKTKSNLFENKVEVQHLSSNVYIGFDASIGRIVRRIRVYTSKFDNRVRQTMPFNFLSVYLCNVCRASASCHLFSFLAPFFSLPDCYSFK